MATLSLDLRRRIVEAYQSGKSGTYRRTAEVFSIGEATVSRLLRRNRETGDVLYKPARGNNPRRVDLAWLCEDLAARPDARLIDRVAAWEQESGRRVGTTTMWEAVGACGWTQEKDAGSEGTGAAGGR